MKQYFLYIIENKVNGKQYIGWTVNTSRRFKCHVNGWKGGSVLVNRAAKKYGISKIEMTILLETTDIEYVKYMEIMVIKHLGTIVPNGYNLTKGGDGVAGLTPWNKGLTKSTDIRLMYISEKVSVTKQGCGPWNKGTAKPKVSRRKENPDTSTQFKTGMVSWNKGTKGVMKENKTSFKKGMTSPNKGRKYGDDFKEMRRKATVGRKRVYNDDGTWYMTPITT